MRAEKKTPLDLHHPIDGLDVGAMLEEVVCTQRRPARDHTVCRIRCRPAHTTKVAVLHGLPYCTGQVVSARVGKCVRAPRRHMFLRKSQARVHAHTTDLETAVALLLGASSPRPAVPGGVSAAQSAGGGNSSAALSMH